MDTYKIERLFHLLMERLDRQEKMISDLISAASGKWRVRRRTRSTRYTTVSGFTTIRTSA